MKTQLKARLSEGDWKEAVEDVGEEWCRQELLLTDGEKAA